MLQKVQKNYPSFGWTSIFFGAHCNGWPLVSSADYCVAIKI